MDRRSLFSSLNTKAHSRSTAPLPVNGGLTPYSGPWTYATAAHLLRRAMFGPSHQQINQAVRDGLSGTLDKLTANLPLPSPPVLYSESVIDPNVRKGQTWVDKPLSPSVQGLVPMKENSLYAWLMEQIFSEGVSLREKMTLFWHNHFVVSDIFDPRYNYEYIQLLREYSLGNFKTLTQKVTIDKSMLVYLNGNQNTNRAPNENYARELMELFTIGKGPVAGPGDYTTFTEQDVLAMAKALTGWIIVSDPRNETFLPYASYNNQRHDISTKQLSHRFNNIQITNAGADEYKNVVDILFTKREAATFICRKLYGYFIYYKIDQAIEDEIINGLADILQANNFEIKPVVRTLLASEHFYSVQALGCMIRPPYEFMFNTLKATKFTPPTDLEQKYNVFLSIYRNFTGMQQVYFDIPTVAGWDPYHQEPAFHEIWINSATYPTRIAFTTQFVNKSFRARQIQTPFGLELPEYVQNLPNPGNATSLVADVVAHLLPQPLVANQLDYLKRTLLGNLTETQWATNWNNYANNPGNTQARTTVDTRLKPFFAALMAMPEYYLS